MPEREPEDVSGDQSEERTDPVNRRPPEEWRPGDPDPLEGGPRPPGEPPHGSADRGPRADPEREAAGGRGEHPTGAPPEPVTGQPSEGPSGPGQAGYEHAGYAPGYGEADGHEAGAGSSPLEGGAGRAPSGGQGQGNGGGNPPPQGGYGSAEAASVPWGKILGIGCGVLLLVLLLVGGCTTVALLAAGTWDTRDSVSREEDGEVSGSVPE